jgi:hypothetical protein
MANISWAFSQLVFLDVPFLDAISASSRKRISEFGTQSLSNTALAFAKLFVPDIPLMAAIS